MMLPKLLMMKRFLASLTPKLSDSLSSLNASSVARVREYTYLTLPLFALMGGIFSFSTYVNQQSASLRIMEERLERVQLILDQKVQRVSDVMDERIDKVQQVMDERVEKVAKITEGRIDRIDVNFDRFRTVVDEREKEKVKDEKEKLESQIKNPKE